MNGAEISNKLYFRQIFNIPEKSNGRIIEKWLKFPSSLSDQRNRSLNFTPAFFRRFKDLEPMLWALKLIVVDDVADVAVVVIVVFVAIAAISGSIS